ncbi:hypothetical protein DV738_g5094, partial [Chaetothyriales sp. CBS 135597]
MAYNKAFNPDALPAHAEPEQAAAAMSALAANRKLSPSGRTSTQPGAPVASPAGNRRPSPAAIAAQHSYHPQARQSYYDPAAPARTQAQGTPPVANYAYNARPETQSAGARRPSHSPSHLPSRTPAPPDADSPELYSHFQAANVSRTGQLTTQELGSALVNGDFTPFDGTTIKSLMQMFSTSAPSQPNGPTITFGEFQSLWRFLAAWRELFERFDEDYNGRISLAEFSKALVAFGYRLSQPFVTLLYKKYHDRGIRHDNDGRRSSVGQSQGQQLGMSFDLFVQACISLKRMTDVFKQYDEDRDGYITVSFEEFLSEILKLSDATSPNAGTSPRAKDSNAPPATPLERMLANAGPIRNDGSDKFWGMENFGNTCYCNSIIQCLYFSAPFRENVLNYPQRTAPEVINAAAKTAPPRPVPNNPQTNGAAKKPLVPPSPRPGAGQPVPQKPEDKESPEYKKKQALLTGPVLNLGYQNAEAYGMPESLFTSLKDLFEAVVVSNKRSGVISPSKFLEVLRKENEMFRSAMHQDAHEFLNLLLNAVVETIEAHDRREREKQQAELKDKPDQVTSEPTDTATVSFPSVPPEPTGRSATRWLHELFEGTLTSETRCLTCENTSRRDEPFLDLSVDLEQHSSVTACLRRFSEEEMLCERNKFHCDNCGGLQEAEKRMKIKRLPKVLALHLKRFKYTEDLQRLQKLFHKVVYPYHLRLFNTTDDAEDSDRIYELYAVVVHIGGGPYHGHYVSIIKTQDRGWLLFDDEMVEPVDRSYVRNFFGDKAGMACAYVLFYQETTVDAIQREQRMEGRRRLSQEVPVGLGLNTKDSAEMPRLFGSPSELVDQSGFASLAHVATAPPLQANGHIDPTHSPKSSSAVVAGRPTSPVVQSKKEKQKEEKARKAAEKQAEKDRAQAEKQAEKDRAQAEKDRRQAATEKMVETRKKQEADLKAALEASKTSKSEEDKRRGHETMVNGVSGTNGVNGNAAPKGLDVFRRSKSLRFASLSKKDKEKEKPSLPAITTTTANGHIVPESTSAIPKEKEKKNHRFSLRKKSFGMLS